MSLLTLSVFVLISGLASAGQRLVYSGDVCSSTPLILSDDQRHGLEVRDSFTQAPLGPAIATNSSESPWKPQGECFTTPVDNRTETFCVFSSQAFADGRGISILTTPDRAEYIRRLPAFVEPDALSGANSHLSPPYEERELPGRGRGLIAKKTLHRGDQIFADTPILVGDEDALFGLEKNDWITLINRAVDELPPGSKEMFWNLYARPKSDPASDRFDTNAFAVGVEEHLQYVVFPEMSLINHDCRPNAVYVFDPRTLTQYVHAMTTIPIGTEITITYVNPLMPRQHRLKHLYSSWRFNCSCSACGLQANISLASDSRLNQIIDLRRQIDQGDGASLQMAETLISLYEQERLYASISDVYQIAALSACSEGQRWSAIKYARLAVEIGLLNDGPDERSLLMKALAEEPEKEPCWLKRVI
ncbi:SET domain-containing protein 5 [Tolypocladium paradoxum]|uniref:SET domain-containing protein 5 n=1 Tax=Tolypocladium paradoxum TaxID=94208 RepID=A0A2S4KVW4_9HYPO|nr:SET domain-containing protein 5 [Tolypocladium paradoxum]